MRKGFNFYRSYWEVAKELNDKDRLSFYDALLKRQFTGIEDELNGLARFAFISQKHSIDQQLKGYFDKTKDPSVDPCQGGSVGGTQGGMQAPSVQEKEKEKEKESIEVRKNKFYASLSAYVSEYPKQMLRDFFDYWTEHGVKDTKMRFEKEKTFGISQRLKTWYNRNPKQYDESTIVDPLVEYVYRKTGIR